MLGPDSPDYFTFSIKVNRYITDYTRLRGEKALQLWYKFTKMLERISYKIDFWLFKMPPSFKYTSENLQTLNKFFDDTKLENKAVIEFRDPSKVTDRIENIGIVFCSVDAPKLPRVRIVSNKTVYLRIIYCNEIVYSSIHLT